MTSATCLSPTTHRSGACAHLGWTKCRWVCYGPDGLTHLPQPEPAETCPYPRTRVGRAGELMSGPLSQNGTRPDSSTKSGPHVSCDIHVFTRQVPHVYPQPPTDQELALILNRLDEMSLSLLWTRWINTSSTARAS